MGRLTQQIPNPAASEFDPAAMDLRHQINKLYDFVETRVEKIMDWYKNPDNVGFHPSSYCSCSKWTHPLEKARSNAQAHADIG